MKSGAPFLKTQITAEKATAQDFTRSNLGPFDSHPPPPPVQFLDNATVRAGFTKSPGKA